MRFLLLAASVGILALNLAGCSCSVSTNCGDMTSGMVGGDCGPTCSTCDTGCTDGCGMSDGGNGLQRPMLMQRLKGRLMSAGQCNDCVAETGGCSCTLGDRMRGFGSRLTGGSDCGCDSGCETGGCGGQSGLGMGMFEVGPDCNTGGCDDCGGGGLMSGFGQKMGSRLASRSCTDGSCGNKLGGGNLLGRVKGCGQFGCGFGGLGCSKCRGAETIPHREPGSMGPGAAGQAPSYVYPYYTTRAPRDFLMDNPPTIGY